MNPELALGLGMLRPLFRAALVLASCPVPPCHAAHQRMTNCVMALKTLLCSESSASSTRRAWPGMCPLCPPTPRAPTMCTSSGSNSWYSASRRSCAPDRGAGRVATSRTGQSGDGKRTKSAFRQHCRRPRTYVAIGREEGIACRPNQHHRDRRWLKLDGLGTQLLQHLRCMRGRGRQCQRDRSVLL